VIKEFQGKYRFLSNFYPCKIMMDGVEYPTVEHAYQASKTMSGAHREIIRLKETPGQAKRYGKIIHIRSDWEDIKGSIMYDLLEQKFGQDNFRRLLLATDDEQLIEGNNWHDRYWGKCYCDRCNGSGENVLGALIMRVRDEIRRESGYKETDREHKYQ